MISHNINTQAEVELLAEISLLGWHWAAPGLQRAAGTGGKEPMTKRIQAQLQLGYDSTHSGVQLQNQRFEVHVLLRWSFYCRAVSKTCLRHHCLAPGIDPQKEAA